MAPQVALQTQSSDMSYRVIGLATQGRRGHTGTQLETCYPLPVEGSARICGA